jgi:hypothetical protein
MLVQATNRKPLGTQSTDIGPFEGVARKIDEEIQIRRDEVHRLQQEVRHLEAEIQRLEVEAERLEVARGSLGSSAPSSRPERVTRNGKPRLRAPSSASSVRDWVRSELRRRNSPMNRSLILEGLRGAGITIQGSDPGRTINKIMARSGEFESSKAGYWFKGEKPPGPVA